MVYFQWKHDGLPEFLRLHIDLQVKCLSAFFEVIIINKDCDYQTICKQHQPDLTLFESGYKSSISRNIVIKNTDCLEEIPKLGMHNGDGWCECRVGFIADMERWGIKTFFTISTTLAEYTPEIANQVFVWPNCIDADIHHDYKQAKVIPVMFNGSMISLYPWRQKIYDQVSKTYPSLIFPHGGYSAHAPLMIYGEQYAQTINAAMFVPACGTITNEIVRKHFEVPGCNACLVTEESPALIAAGFVDMENCVFANEHNVLDKLEYLFRNPSELKRITAAGYTLVHTRHTLKQRDQILQWYQLNCELKADEKIIQAGPFKSLEVVKRTSGINTGHIYSNGLYLALLNEGNILLEAGKYMEAESCYLQCLSYIPWMSEPKLKLALCSLSTGNANEAHQWIIQPIQNVLGTYLCPEPDPIEWAYYLITLLCQGRLKDATIRGSQFIKLDCDALTWSRGIVKYLNEGETTPFYLTKKAKTNRASIHVMPKENFESWLTSISMMLKVCGKQEFAKRLIPLFEETKFGQIIEIKPSARMLGYFMNIRIGVNSAMNQLFAAMNVPNRKTGLPSITIKDFLIRLYRWTKQSA